MQRQAVVNEPALLRPDDEALKLAEGARNEAGSGSVP